GSRAGHVEAGRCDESTARVFAAHRRQSKPSDQRGRQNSSGSATATGSGTRRTGKPRGASPDDGGPASEADTDREAHPESHRGEPGNAEAIKGLASALFREDKTDEAAAVLDKLPKD